VTARSNASNPLNNIVIQAEYPTGFSEIESSRPPISGQNVWLIETLPPEGEVSFTVTGSVEGITDESLQTRFTAGLSDGNNRTSVASMLSKSAVDFLIERPFIRVTSRVSGGNATGVVLAEGESTPVTIQIQNTLNEPVYDMRVEVTPTGNVVSPESISSGSGFYDSNSGTIRWDVAGNDGFAVINPGDERTISFTIRPNATRGSASMNFSVNVYAKRIVDNQSIEQLIGVGEGSVKYASDATIGSQVERNTRFVDTGVIPPRVGETTTYTLTLVAQAGANDITDARVTTSLPTYVNWLNEIRGDGRIVFNTISKQLEWVIGDVKANQSATVSFQVSVLPSLSQVGRPITLMNQQTLQARESFTNIQLRDTADACSTELSTEADFAPGNGIVQPAN
jgi:hypothetical protein